MSKQTKVISKAEKNKLNNSQSETFNFVFKPKEWPTLEEASEILNDAQESKIIYNIISKKYLKCDDNNRCIERDAVILNDIKLSLFKLEYETKMGVAQIRLEKLKIQEDMLLMKLNYHKSCSKDMSKAPGTIPSSANSSFCEKNYKFTFNSPTPNAATQLDDTKRLELPTKYVIHDWFDPISLTNV